MLCNPFFYCGNSTAAHFKISDTVQTFNATQYGAGNVVSTNGDIYSYGILVLEMVTARRPTDTTFREGLSLREYVELALLHNGTMDIIDMRLSLSLKNDELQGARGRG